MAPAAKLVGLVWRPHSGCHARDRAVRLAHRARAPRRRTPGGHTPSGRRPRGPKALTGSCASKPMSSGKTSGTLCTLLREKLTRR